MFRRPRNAPEDNLFSLQQKINANKENILKDPIIQAKQKFVTNLKKFQNDLADESQIKTTANALFQFLTSCSATINNKANIQACLENAGKLSSVTSLVSSQTNWNKQVTTLKSNLVREISQQQNELDELLKTQQQELKILEAKRDTMNKALSKLIFKHEEKLKGYQDHLAKDVSEEAKFVTKQNFTCTVSALLEDTQSLLSKLSQKSTPEDFSQLEKNIKTLYNIANNNRIKAVISVHRTEDSDNLLNKAEVFFTSSKGEEYFQKFSDFMNDFAKQAKIPGQDLHMLLGDIDSFLSPRQNL